MKLTHSRPITTLVAASTYQVYRQASSPKTPVNGGTMTPVKMIARLPPDAAMPAATPRSVMRNHGANIPIMGVNAAPDDTPTATIAARAIQ